MRALNNPPAFPTTKPLDGWGDPNQGMTLRDWFAGQVICGLSGACSEVTQTLHAIAAGEGRALGSVMVELAYERADAMLAERTKDSVL